MTKWELTTDGEYYEFMHILDDGTDMHHVQSLKRETEVTHSLLEFLAKLKVISYERGYDGIYWSVLIKT